MMTMLNPVPVKRMRSCGATILALSLVFGLGHSPSKAGVNIMAFQPSPFQGDILSVQNAGIGSGGLFTVGMNFHFTSRPLAIEGRDTFGNVALESSVTSRTMAELLVSVAPLEWLDIGLAMPFVIMGEGKAEGTGLSTLGDLSGFTLGELRLSIRAALVQHHVVRLAFQADGTFPTGDDAKLSQNGFGGGARLLFDVRSGIFTFALNAGAYFRGETGVIAGLGGAPTYLSTDHELLAGMGASLQVSPALRVVAEMYMRTPLDDPMQDNGTQIEAMGGLRVTPAVWCEFTMGGGGGTPLAAGYGTSQYRFFGEMRFIPQASMDTDRDAIRGDDDACPYLPEDFDGFEDEDGCPDPDNDGDSLLDADDKCPDRPEDMDGYADSDGCPELDNDGDGIDDGADKCPLDAEDLDDFEDDDGCPELDNDGDRIPDSRDRCPMDRENNNGHEDDDGCPDFPGVSLQGDSVVLTPPLVFKKNSVALSADAMAQVYHVARLLLRTPEWKLRVDVHSGRKGKSSRIKALTERQAERLMQLLVTEGIDIRRLTVRGLGNSVPLGDLRKRADRTRSTRVEFIIVK